MVPNATISLAATEAERFEGDSGLTLFPFEFVATRTGDQEALSKAATVHWKALGSGANPVNTDDLSPSGVIVFEPGETSKPIVVQIVGDTIPESLEERVQERRKCISLIGSGRNSW